LYRPEAAITLTAATTPDHGLVKWVGNQENGDSPASRVEGEGQIQKGEPALVARLFEKLVLRSEPILVELKIPDLEAIYAWDQVSTCDFCYGRLQHA